MERMYKFWQILLVLVTVLSGLRAQGQVGAKAAASLSGDYNDNDYHDVTHDGLSSPEDKSLVFIRELKNITKEQGDSLKIKCEVSGDPPATKFKWFFNEAPLFEEQGRIKVKTFLKGSSSQFSVLRFQELEVLDKGYYRCEASNDFQTIKSTSVINVVLGNGRNKKFDSNSDYLHLPDHRSYQNPFDQSNILSNGIEGLPDHIIPEFDGRNSAISQSFVSGHQSAAAELPSLKPNEKAGVCQKYVGTACGETLGDSYVWVSTDQHYADQQLSLTFHTITASKMMSPRCSQFAIQAICHSTFPLCDKRSQKPRKLCREECEVLEQDYCKSELEAARSHPAIFQQMVFPECDELPPIGSIESSNCVQLNIPNTGQLIQPHSCYNGVGSSYRGTHSMTSSGLHCKPWKDQIVIDMFPDHMELVGGHNYCRNPEGPYEMEEPWCFTDDPNNLKQVKIEFDDENLSYFSNHVNILSKFFNINICVIKSDQPDRQFSILFSNNTETIVVLQVCGLPQCSDFNIWLYVVLPASVALVMVAVILAICCMRQGHKKPLSVTTSSPR